MTYYNWTEILKKKTNTELANIHKDRHSEPEDKVSATLKELKNRGIKTEDFAEIIASPNPIIEENSGWLNILKLIIPYVIVVGIFQAIGASIVNVDITDLEAILSPIQKLVILLFTFTGTLIILWIFMKNVDEKPFISLGFQTKNRAKDIFCGLGLGTLIMALGFIILLTINQIEFLKYNLNGKELLISLLIFIIVAFVEETLIRGYIQRNLMRSFNKYIALIISSILFSLLHFANPHFDLTSFINLFLAGILLGLSYIHTKNLWFPIALHFSWNFFQTLFGFNVSGDNNYSLIEISIPQNNLLNGGPFGFEGSLLGSLMQIIAIIAIIVYYQRKNTITNHTLTKKQNAKITAVLP